MKKLIYITLVLVLTAAACDDKEDVQHSAPVLLSTLPSDGAQGVASSQVVQLRFDEVVTPAIAHGVSVNGEAVEIKVSTLSLTTLELEVALESAKTYEVKVPAGAVINTFGEIGRASCRERV